MESNYRHRGYRKSSFLHPRISTAERRLANLGLALALGSLPNTDTSRAGDRASDCHAEARLVCPTPIVTTRAVVLQRILSFSVNAGGGRPLWGSKSPSSLDTL
jgi:hypothetical protein